jgi:hypothetical protein
MTYEEFLEAVHTDAFRKWLRSYGRKLNKAFTRHAQLKRFAKSVDTFLGVLGFERLRDFAARVFEKRLARFTDVVTSVSLFRQYLKDATQVPLFWIEDENGPKESGGHWVQGVLNVLTGELGYSQSEALNLPLAKAFADCLKASERKGGIRLMTEDEIAEVKKQGGI